ncbi:MAG: M23 family metallopeptidase [Lawsonibacter sp.]|nr:M23 family metallopeptidase [Lawsonibacter sp.]
MDQSQNQSWTAQLPVVGEDHTERLPIIKRKPEHRAAKAETARAAKAETARAVKAEAARAAEQPSGVKEAKSAERASKAAPAEQPSKAGPAEAAERPARTRSTGQEILLYLQGFGEWSRIHIRRWTHLFHSAAAGTLAVGPISFLVMAGALGAALTLTTLYSTSYAVIVDGREVGVVADQSVVDQAIQTVETRGSQLLGYDYRVNGNIDYNFTLALKSDLSQPQDISNYFYSQLNELSDQLRAYEVVVDGRTIGTVKDETALNGMLEAIKDQFVTEDTTSADFVEDLSVHTVYAVDSLMTVDQVEAALKANTTGETTYTVVKGDTYNGIAYANDMSLSDLMALNPDVSLNRLMVGDVLNVKEVIPTLSVRTTEQVTYTEPIPCPVEEVQDDKMYKGDSKIVTQGEEGEALVSADVVYVNGYERDRTVTNSQTLREPTVTVKAVGTKERPKTASKGTYIWPVRSHRINSYFGGRNIFGSYSFHSGIDLHAAYGENVMAADGGTVTKAGWSSGYGNLVVITHDNGTQTYYGHNSSLVVSVGQKVYQGQVIAKAGSTGRSTGVHCHFEVRVHGTAVNPLNYLR